MAEHLNVAPDELRQAAGGHRETADYFATVPSGHAAILASLESLDAGMELLNQRRVCYEQQAAAHAELADRLFEAAGRWEEHDADAAEQLRDVGEGSR
jgi:hypothetical protein